MKQTNNLVPEYIIDTFYEQIKCCIEEKRNYQHYVNSILKLNKVLPKKIQELLDSNNDTFKAIIKGNEMIQLYMGWEYMTPQEIVDYNYSDSSLVKARINPEEYAKRPNQPNLKRKGSIISTISHDDVFYSDLLNYHHSIDALMPVIEKLSKEYYNHDDLLTTIQYLLKGVPNDELNFSVENLWKRVVKLITTINS